MNAGGGPVRPDLESAILALERGDSGSFDALLEEIRQYQRQHNPVVAAFDDAGSYLPVAAFREARVACFPPGKEEGYFLSSGTGSGQRSRHPVRSYAWYDRVSGCGFDRAFGALRPMVAGHLPEYADESSLVRMVRSLASREPGGEARVRTFEPETLVEAAEAAAGRGRPFLLVGAAFGLLDLVERGPVPLPGTVRVIETGGMKTRRREIARDALHARLAAGFGIPTEQVGSEYGMCELTSQAWAPSGAWFDPPPWMRVRVVDPEHPDRGLPDGTPGRIAIEDLANLYSAACLLTEDLGVAEGRRFTVTGRLRGSALRGCNLLFEP